MTKQTPAEKAKATKALKLAEAMERIKAGPRVPLIRSPHKTP